ncbi:hypothetical protein F441_13022 [Phytophthora nicotianae CJ01A1]|uniref:Uncharacterized protein n=2 Tax=Phytophthora nicotianae TaxID=4792 RepID=W2INT2_PHYNI|nr:hypothetical protein L916_12667 [Phytophthora nicotianae]ETM41658.1 hypothetical protein L914_12584 [Phytophthora nicotianae]ETP11462.1 hypothetical protein F441_13022 [Phytophthora nicotianae CJ01A1]
MSADDDVSESSCSDDLKSDGSSVHPVNNQDKERTVIDENKDDTAHKVLLSDCKWMNFFSFPQA